MKAPDYLLSGQAAVLECKSGASNPPAEIQWEVRKTGGEEKGQAGEVRGNTDASISLSYTIGVIILNILDRSRLGDYL